MVELMLLAEPVDGACDAVQGGPHRLHRGFAGLLLDAPARRLLRGSLSSHRLQNPTGLESQNGCDESDYPAERVPAATICPTVELLLGGNFHFMWRLKIIISTICEREVGVASGN